MEYLFSFYRFPSEKKNHPNIAGDTWFCASVFCCLPWSLVPPSPQCPPRSCLSLSQNNVSLVSSVHVWHWFRPFLSLFFFSHLTHHHSQLGFLLLHFFHHIRIIIWYASDSSFYSNFCANFSLVKVLWNGVALISYANVLLRRKEAVSFTFSI